MKVTLDAIAALAGVSTATVSRSLQQSRLIHPATRAHVLDVAMRLGYQGRSRRGSGSKRATTTLGILLPFRSVKSGHLITLHCLQGITSEADATDILLRLEEVRSDAKGQMASRRFLPKMVKDRLVDAVVLIESHSPTDVAELSQLVPVVSIQYEYEGATIDMVEAANCRGVKMLVDHLVELKHRRIAWVRAEFKASFFRDREAGFIQGCLEHNLPFDLSTFLQSCKPEESPDRFRSELKNALKRGITAILCANDTTAEQVAKHLLALGVKIPETVSLAGYDASKYMVDGRLLTSFDPAFIEVGRAAVRVALQRMAEPSSPPIIQMRTGKIFAGETVGPANSFA
jgi:LacI family repressor for deo operon, udp, cdd, tsx, nupC, and nupG